MFPKADGPLLFECCDSTRKKRQRTCVCIFVSTCVLLRRHGPSQSNRRAAQGCDLLGLAVLLTFSSTAAAKSTSFQPEIRF